MSRIRLLSGGGSIPQMVSTVGPFESAKVSGVTQVLNGAQPIARILGVAGTPSLTESNLEARCGDE